MPACDMGRPYLLRFSGVSGTGALDTTPGSPAFILDASPRVSDEAKPPGGFRSTLGGLTAVSPDRAVWAKAAPAAPRLAVASKAMRIEARMMFSLKVTCRSRGSTV